MFILEDIDNGEDIDNDEEPGSEGRAPGYGDPQKTPPKRGFVFAFEAEERLD